MTKKDYKLIAGVFSEMLEQYHDIYTNSKWGMDRDDRQFCRGAEVAAVKLAKALAKDNPRFDREKFLEACKVVYKTED